MDLVVVKKCWLGGSITTNKAKKVMGLSTKERRIKH